MSSTPASAPNTGDALNDAYRTTKNLKDTPGKKEQTFDNIGNTIASTGQSPTAAFLDKFFQDNRSTLSLAAAGIASLDTKTIDNAISGFGESVKVVLKGLDALSTIHPFIGVAVVAFKLVVTLDMTRRENNQKVLAVKIQMQQMMCTLFQLRQMKDQDEVGPDGRVLKDRMQPLIAEIAQYIRECGSACDVYLKKGVIVRTLMSKFYEERLGSYVSGFVDYRDQLDKALNVHIALGVDAANTKLQSIEVKLDVLFRRLDTHQERKARDFIDKNGGPKVVTENDDLLQGLIKQSGDPADKSLTGKNAINSFKEKLRKEMKEDVEAVLKRNLTHFNHKLDMQYENITETLESMVNFLSAAPDKVKDADLQALWKHMGWKGSVKARHFVLALRDHFADKFVPGSRVPRAEQVSTAGEALPESTPSPIDHLAIQTVPRIAALLDDQWALQYLSVPNLQSILEAIDGDGSGFISIKEVNTFAMERPQDWKLLHWLAFWGKGWERSLAQYKTKITFILQEMGRLFLKLRKENWTYVDTYLQHSGITDIQLILRSTKVDQEGGQVSAELADLTEAYMGAEEEQLRKNLEKIGYDMDSTATVTLVTGPGRIERYLFPLLYLTLKRHLEVFHYACRHVVDFFEFYRMAATLGSIFDVVDQRVETLRVIYKQMHVNPEGRLENFALGMFHDFAVSRYSSVLHASLLVGWKDGSSADESDENEIIENPKDAEPLFSDPDSEDNYHGIWRGWPPHSFETDPCTGTLDGFWTGQFYIREGSRRTCPAGMGLVQLKIEVDPEDSSLLKGFAVTYSDQFRVYGRRRGSKDADGDFEEFDIVISCEEWLPMEWEAARLVGRFIGSDTVLVGSWDYFNDEWDAREAYDAHPFSLHPQTGIQERVKLKGEGVEREGKEAETKEELNESREEEEEIVKREQETNEEATPETANNDVDRAGDNGVAEHQLQSSAVEGKPGSSETGAKNGEEPVNSTPASTEGEEEPFIGTFTFRRTPVEIYRYRHILDGDQNKAKARWNFLRETILYLVRARLWSWSHLKTWGVDCRTFLDYYKRDQLRQRGFVIHNPLTEEEGEAWQILKYRLPPGMISLCVGSLAWSLRRLPVRYGLVCDGCGDRPFESRFICLTCIDPEMSNSFDLCHRCIDKAAARDEFAHTTDHTLIKARQYLPKYLFVWLINEARSMTTRLKKTFATLPRSEQGAHRSDRRSEFLCGCCAKPVSIPCWACLTCTPETYICNECEEGELPALEDGPGSPNHSPDHYLLRLHNPDPVRFEKEKVDPTMARVNAMDTAINQRFGALESRITALETNIGALLTLKSEYWLRKIAVQLNVPDREEQTSDKKVVANNSGQPNPSLHPYLLCLGFFLCSFFSFKLLALCLHFLIRL